MSEKCDVLIIGAGILGCFAARYLAMYNLNVKVIEKREDVCTGITRANTGIIYQGYDQHPGSLKAMMCQRASKKFVRLCEELDVPYRKTGLMMLSFGPKADGVLEKKLKQGMDAGIPGLNIIEKEEILEKEPNLQGNIKRALLAENTYTVNPWDLGIAAFEIASENGTEFRFNEEVMKIARDGDGFVVETKRNSNVMALDGFSDSHSACACETYNASRVLCCAGLNGDLLWEMVSQPKIRLVPEDADYIIFDKAAGGLINHVISVEPEEKGEGLTLIPTLDGNIMAGPTRRPHFGTVDFSTDRDGLKELLDKCVRLVPGLTGDLMIRSFGAIRPNPFEMIETDQNESIDNMNIMPEAASVTEGFSGKRYVLSNRSIKDFSILTDNGFMSLIGVKTPGITCANELGAYAAGWIVSSLGREQDMNLLFRSRRKRIVKPEGGEIICRCRKVTKEEVVEAIKRGATTVNGVKRRTGAGMGHCQGGICQVKIMHILADELNIDIRDVTLDGIGTEILMSEKL